VQKSLAAQLPSLPATKASLAANLGVSGLGGLASSLGVARALRRLACVEAGPAAARLGWLLRAGAAARPAGVSVWLAGLAGGRPTASLHLYSGAVIAKLNSTGWLKRQTLRWLSSMV